MYSIHIVRSNNKRQLRQYAGLQNDKLELTCLLPPSAQLHYQSNMLSTDHVPFLYIQHFLMSRLSLYTHARIHVQYNGKTIHLFTVYVVTHLGFNSHIEPITRLQCSYLTLRSGKGAPAHV